MAKRTRIFKMDTIGTDDSTFHDMIMEAAGVIGHGGVVAFPTETVYGLGANALDTTAVQKIFEAKGRPVDNPLIVHIASKQQCIELAENIPEKAFILMDMFWPGPLTLILKRKDIVPDVTTGGLDTVALRMPDNRIALSLIRASGKAIAAPSANLSGKPSPTTAQHVISDLSGRIDIIIDGGPVRVGVESTVIDMTLPIPVILRPGKVSIEELEAGIGHVSIGYGDKELPGTTVPRSPGMKYTHYSPNARVVLIEGEAMDVTRKIQDMLAGYGHAKVEVALLLTDGSMDVIDHQKRLSMGSGDRPDEIAFNLFAGLRSLDTEDTKTIIVDGSFSRKGVGTAVSNRIHKAAYSIINV